MNTVLGISAGLMVLAVTGLLVTGLVTWVICFFKAVINADIAGVVLLILGLLFAAGIGGLLLAPLVGILMASGVIGGAP